MGSLSKTFGKLTIPLLLLLAISFFAAPAYAKYGGGTGQPNDPYLIFDIMFNKLRVPFRGMSPSVVLHRYSDLAHS